MSPATDAVNTMLEWARPDLDPRFVHVRRDGEDRLIDQHSSYKGRTSVSIDGLRRGDMSLKLSKVKFSDEGTYRCFVPGFGTDTSIKLVVGKPANMLSVQFQIIFHHLHSFVQCVLIQSCLLQSGFSLSHHQMFSLR